MGRMLTINRPVGHRLLPHTDSLWVSPRGRRLLFRQLNAHPERFDPAATAYSFRASQCAVYRDLLDAVMKEAPHRLDRIRCRVLLAWPENDRVLAFERYGQPLLGALPGSELRMLSDVGHRT
jgi:pimeloyl-ACP methyl ester carboxylesterase